MDPVSQGVLGALASQSTSSNNNLYKAAFVGALAGMAPDLDVLIRSPSDPLLFLQYHRHFTHSLFFIPIGGFICGMLAWWLFGRRWNVGRKTMVIWATAGYATHGLLDACTSYGTLLLWPLSDHRFSWDIVSIIDPLFTVPLLAGVLWSARRGNKRGFYLALCWMLFYGGLAIWQHERALTMGQQLAESRGHSPGRLEAKPSFANIAVWKVIYENEGMFYVDAVKPGLMNSRVWQGESLPRLDLERDLPWLDPGSQQARDVARFDWFSSGYVALHPDDPNRVIDVRYSLLPQEISALWGIKLTPGADPDTHAHFYTARNDSRSAAGKLWQMVME